MNGAIYLGRRDERLAHKPVSLFSRVPASSQAKQHAHPATGGLNNGGEERNATFLGPSLDGLVLVFTSGAECIRAVSASIGGAAPAGRKHRIGL